MRNASKWLTPESLRAGSKEEYAVERWPRTYSVVLSHDALSPARPWLVVYTVRTRAGAVVEASEFRYERLNDARLRWRTQVRKTRA